MRDKWTKQYKLFFFILHKFYLFRKYYNSMWNYFIIWFLATINKTKCVSVSHGVLNTLPTWLTYEYIRIDNKAKYDLCAYIYSSKTSHGQTGDGIRIIHSSISFMWFYVNYKKSISVVTFKNLLLVLSSLPRCLWYSLTVKQCPLHIHIQQQWQLN